ncbi:MAG: G5 domain-containing protein [Clostridia bacterium]|nr:G5 domain-containing protein [Clostridia bacterium]
MKKRNKKTFSMIRITLTIIALIAMSGAGVMAMNTKVNSVDITLSDGYKLTVLTSKTKVADILKDNNILVGEDEKVSPKQNENITDEGKIVISNKSKQEIQVAKVSESGIETTLDSLLQAYDDVVEKIEVKKEEIPFETIKKDISDGAKSTKNKVLQEGENGIKEITYKVKYQNNTEIKRTKISEKIIKKPTDKIVQVRSNVTSRSSDTIRGSDLPSTSIKSTKSESSSGKTKIYKITAYCSCAKCCGKSNGITACGKKAKAGRTIAAPRGFSFGTKLSINGKTYVVEDRGGAIKGNRIDMYVNSHSEALRWGVKYLPVKVID